MTPPLRKVDDRAHGVLPVLLQGGEHQHSSGVPQCGNLSPSTGHNLNGERTVNGCARNGTASLPERDWSQFKALVKAQVQDERDGSGEGKRVKKIIERADYASAYADMLGFGKMNENEKTRSSSSAPQPAARRAERPSVPPLSDSAPAHKPAPAPTLIEPEGIPDFLQRVAS